MTPQESSDNSKNIAAAIGFGLLGLVAASFMKLKSFFTLALTAIAALVGYEMMGSAENKLAQPNAPTPAPNPPAKAPTPPQNYTEITPTVEGSKTLKEAAKMGRMYRVAQATTISADTLSKLEKSFENIPSLSYKPGTDEHAAMLVIDKNGARETWRINSTENNGLLKLTCHNYPAQLVFINTDQTAEAIKAETLSSIAAIQVKEGTHPSIDADVVQELKKTFKNTKDVRFAAVKDDIHSYALTIKQEGGDDVWYMDNTLPEDRKYGPRARFTSAKDETVSFVAGKFAMDESILGTINAIHRDAQNEKDDPAEVTKYTLPKDNIPIGYIGLNGMLDPQNASNFADDIAMLKAMPELLTRCGHKMVCADDKHGMIDMHANPAKAVIENIERLHKEGVRHFYINVMAHGTQLGTHSHWEENRAAQESELTAAKWQEIIAKYPDCNFTINSAACHSGGLIEMMRHSDDLGGAENRVNVFVQTKQRDVNIGGRYNNALVEQLTHMAEHAPGAPATYGEAHRRADLIVKRMEADTGMCDAQYLKNAKDKTKNHTAYNDALKAGPAGETGILVTEAGLANANRYLKEQGAAPAQSLHVLPAKALPLKGLNSSLS